MTRTWSASGRTRNGAPGATPMPRAARATAARALVGDLDPQVDAVAAGARARRAASRTRRRAPRGGRTPPGRGPSRRPSPGRGAARAAPPAGAGWTSPGPSSRRLATAATTSPAPPTAARRRSGPWLLEKLRMWTVRSGSHEPRLTSARRRCRWRGRPRRRASFVPGSSAASSAARSHAQRARRPGSALAAGGRRRPRVAAASATRRPVDVEPSSSTSTPMTSHPSCSSRSSIGGNVGCSTTTRSPRRSTSLGDAIEGVHRPVDDGQRLRRERPRRRAAPPRAPAAPGGRGSSTSATAGATRANDRAEVGQQVGIGRARRQVELRSAPGPP